MTENLSVLDIVTSPDFVKVLDVILQPYKDRISALENKYSEQTNKIAALEKQIRSTEEMTQSHKKTPTNIETTACLDLEEVKQIEMKQKYQNLILQGLPEEENENLQAKMHQILQEKFQTTAQIDCCRIGKKKNTTNQEESQKVRPILISFNNVWKRREIYRQRVKGLKNSGLFICEDLPREQMTLAYMARECKRKGKIKSTWTQDWQIMVKDTPTSPPRELTMTDTLITNLQNEMSSENTQSITKVSSKIDQEIPEDENNSNQNGY